jgi:drug/metabolite transporter (DMT)-like permease
MADARTPSATLLPPLLLLILGLNWGFGFVLSKLGVTGGLMPLGYAFWQCLGSGLLLWAIAAWRGEWPPLGPRHLRYYIIAGVTNISIPASIALFCVQHIPIGVMVLLVTLSPLLTYALAQMLRTEKFHPRRAIGMLLGFAGALLILLPRASLPSPEMAWWAALGVLTPAFYAVSNIYIGVARPADVPSLALGAAMQTAAGLAILPVALLAGEFHLLLPPFTPAMWANFSHVAVAGLGALLLFEIVRLAGPVYMSQVGYIVCLSGVLWGWLVFDERHSLWVWAAMALILAGLTLVTMPGRKA